jgi:broad specificity phosphatase PhoE
MWLIQNEECAQALRVRLERSLRQILNKHPRRQIPISCHGGIIRIALEIMLVWPFPKLRAIDLEYASITRVIWSSGQTKLPRSISSPGELVS